MEHDLNGRVALITGAGSGLGEATARAFANAGAAVGCLDVKQDAAERVASEISYEGGKALATPCDVRDLTSVLDAIETVCAHFGGVDFAINNAGVDHTVPVEEMTVEQWDQVVGVNLRGPFLVSKAVFPIMRDRGGGHIVNVASTAAQRFWANAAAYHASKSGLVGFSRGLGVEGRPHNIRVTTIIPGGMKTHMFDRFAAQGIPMPDEANLQSPANVAEAILFAVRMGDASVVQELMVTPLTETSWP